MAIPSTFDAVKAHLAQLKEDPSVSLDVVLIDKLKLQLVENTPPIVASTLLSQISALLPILQEDPTPLTDLAIRATLYFSFADLRSIKPPIDLVAGLKAPWSPINLVTLSLLSKAGQTSSDAAIIATDSGLVASLVELWLSTSSTAVAQAALDALWAMLEVDLASPLEKGDYENIRNEGRTGQGLLWRRMFADKDVYGLLFGLCSLKNDAPGELSRRERTVAQGRLMSLLVKTSGLRWDLISKSQVPEVEEKYASKNILHFAACRMIDSSDVLMHMTLISFYRELLEIDAPGLGVQSYAQPASSLSSPALDFLISENVHSRVLEYYLDESKLDPVDLIYLSGPIMAYVARYSQSYPNHLLKSPPALLNNLVACIGRALAIPATQWAHGEVPTGHLAILASLPRVLLVESGKNGTNPLLAIPTNPPNEEAFDVLGKIFRGPIQTAMSDSAGLTSGQTPTDWLHEAASARILYFSYLNEHPTFWADVVAAADIVAMKDVALAAVKFIQSVIEADWKPLPATDTSDSSLPYHLPSEESLDQLSPAVGGKLPISGPWAVLTPPALDNVLPYLFKPPRSYGEFVAGGAGDNQSAVWKLATAKYEALVALYRKLQEIGSQVEGVDDILRTLKQRVNEGPMGPVQAGGPQVEAVGL